MESSHPRELEEFIRETLSQIDSGLGENYNPKDVVRFEIAITKSTDLGGKLDIKVVEAGAKTKSEVVSKIMFEAKRDYDKHPAYSDSRKQIEGLSNHDQLGDGDGIYS